MSDLQRNNSSVQEIQFKTSFSNQTLRLWERFVKPRTTKESSRPLLKFKVAAECVCKNFFSAKKCNKG